MPVCSAPGCPNTHRNTGPETTWHRFPIHKPEHLSRWLHNLRRANFQPVKSSLLCSVHFTDDCFDPGMFQKIMGLPYKRNKLKEDAVPSLFKHRPEVKPRLHTERRIADKERKELVAKLLKSTQSEEQSKTTKPTIKRTWTSSAASAEGFSESRTSLFSNQSDEFFTPVTKKQLAEATVTRSYLGLQELPAEMPPCKPSAMPPPVYGLPRYVGLDHTYAQSLQLASKRIRVASSSAFYWEPSPPAVASESSYLKDVLSSSSSSLPASASGTEYYPRNCVDSDVETPVERTNRQEGKYIASESNLLELFNFCKLCGCAVVSKETSTLGSMLTVKAECDAGHKYSWQSQNVHHQMPWGNLLITAAILFTCAIYTFMHDIT